MIALIDNGHGKETAGKRSPRWPDGTQLFEYEFNRDVARRIVSALKAKGYKAELLVAEEKDISLPERVKRANSMHRAVSGGAVLVSIHGNASPDANKPGTGWECFTSIGETRADKYATILCEEAQRAFPDQRMRFDYTDGDPDKEADFYLLKNTACPAILTENFFMDNEKDCRMMMSDAGRQKIADFHVAALERILA